MNFNRAIKLFFLFIFIFSCSTNRPTSGGHDLPNLVKVKISSNNELKKSVSLYKIVNNDFIKVTDTVVDSNWVNFIVNDSLSSYVVLAYSSDSLLGGISKAEIGDNVINFDSTTSLTLTDINSGDEILLYPYPDGYVSDSTILYLNKIPKYLYKLYTSTDSGLVFNTEVDLQNNDNLIINQSYYSADTLINWDFDGKDTPQFDAAGVVVGSDSSSLNFNSDSYISSKSFIASNRTDVNGISIQLNLDMISIALNDTLELLNLFSNTGLRMLSLGCHGYSGGIVFVLTDIQNRKFFYDVQTISLNNRLTLDLMDDRTIFIFNNKIFEGVSINNLIYDSLYLGIGTNSNSYKSLTMRLNSVKVLGFKN